MLWQRLYAMSLLSIDKQHHELQSVIEQLNEEKKSTQDNRRRRPRKEINIALWVYLLGLPNVPRVKVHTRNISVSGIAFLCKRSFPDGMYVATQLESNGLVTGKMLLTKVRFCRYVRQGHFQVGAEFAEAVDGGPEEIPNRWIDRAVQAAALDALMKS